MFFSASEISSIFFGREPKPRSTSTLASLSIAQGGTGRDGTDPLLNSLLAGQIKLIASQPDYKSTLLQLKFALAAQSDDPVIARKFGQLLIRWLCERTGVDVQAHQASHLLHHLIGWTAQYFKRTYFGTGKPRCVKHDLGEEKITPQGVKYFELECRYLDYDGNVFYEVTERLGIEEFRGARRIDSLNAFPLEEHPTKETLETDLITCGKKYVSIMGSYYCHYRGNADRCWPFWQSNPNYPRI
ncbi:MAG: hypothetical protein M1825_000346 [Sarcosagium campestre]|nr:MAG: hypothetical protein M1825_000346 [Sarcosagium campestre]